MSCQPEAAFRQHNPAHPWDTAFRIESTLGSISKPLRCA
jgi:hypothetical protein